ncbi:Nurim [Larimichthys crocea]|uniref:Uncharacterized protein n=1 Tax=Larimichthys crocea TaxID=215358 RepID=A0ACD3RFJ1_LARCR|nr:Nurim [Larimichthys crocea]
MRYWQPVTDAPCLWSVRNAPWSIWFPLLCFSLHFLCWTIICSILLIFDYPELMGVKQVYYECLGLGDPLSHKSPCAQRFLSHFRHPVCLELGCRAVAPAGLVPGQAPVGGDSVDLPGTGTLSGQTGFSLPLCPL